MSDNNTVLIPPEVLPDHVLGLIETVYTLGGKIDPMYIGDVIGENIEVLPHTIDLAEVLGLITYRDGIVTLTETGESIVKSNMKIVVKKLRELASRLQPLRDIVEILKSKGYLEVEEYRNIIIQKYPNNYRKAYHHILIWGAFLRLFKMDEKDSKIIPIDLRSL